MNYRFEALGGAADETIHNIMNFFVEPSRCTSGFVCMIVSWIYWTIRDIEWTANIYIFILWLHAEVNRMGETGI
jgi:hypothetical protein